VGLLPHLEFLEFGHAAMWRPRGLTTHRPTAQTVEITPVF